MSFRFSPLKLRLALAAAFVGATLPAQAAQGLRVDGEPVKAAAPKRTEAWRAAGLSAGEAATLHLRPLAVERVDALRKRNAEPGIKALQIGIARDLTTESDGNGRITPVWQTQPDGRQVARLAIVAPGAKALRTGLRWNQLPVAAELRFAGSNAPDMVIGTTTGAEANQQRGDALEFWSPVTFGERQEIEITLPRGADPAALALQIPSASHLVVDHFDRNSLAKGLGDAGSCNSNTVCRNDLGQGYINATRAVARMAFTSSGSSYTCTGTLLNDTDSSTQIPYFFAANHCIGSQAEANTLSTFWFFEAANCGDRYITPTTTTQVTGGATLLHANRNLDTVLLRLNKTPPPAAFFAGWDAGAVASGTAVIGIHHPSGDLKKVSTGTTNGLISLTNSAVNGAFIGAVWQQGTTEGGSSGSGLFTIANGQYYLRGALYGGQASCQNVGGTPGSGNQDYYSRLDLIYNDLKQYLSPTPAAPAPTRDYTGTWFNAGESGWGVMVTQFPSNAMFVAQFFYAGNREPTWWVIVNGSWTATDKFSGTLAKYSGPAFTPGFDGGQVSSAGVGTATLTFTSANTMTFDFSAGGVTRSVQLSKMSL